MKREPSSPLSETHLDALLEAARPHKPSSDVAEETLAWISGDLENLGGWVPPVRRGPVEEVVSFELAVASYAWHRRARVPLAAGACLLLFVVSTAVAVTETQTPERYGALGFGEIATLDSFLEDRSDRFATLLVHPPPPTKRHARFSARLQRVLDTTPAGRRTIGTTRASRPGVLGTGGSIFGVATVTLGDAIAGFSGQDGNAGLSALMAESQDLTGRGRREGLSPRTLPSGKPSGSREVVLGGALTGNGEDHATGSVLGNRTEPMPLVNSETAESFASSDASVSDETVRRVVRAHRAELRACYERELRRASGLRARVELRWTLSSDGSVGHVQVNSASPRWPALEECLVQAVSSWSFPPPPGSSSVSVNYPVVFRPKIH